MIALKTFTGEFPRIQPQLLPDNGAASAVDCDFTRGNLIGIRERSLVLGFAAPAGVKSLFAYDGVANSMFAWTRDVDAVRGPIPSDQYNRFYWSDGSGFYVSRGDIGGSGQEPSTVNRYKVGCPTPTGALGVTLGAKPALAEGVSEYPEFRAYTYTYVNQYGEESGMAPPATVDVVEGQAVNLWYTNLPDAAGYCPISMIRIYRTSTGSSGTDYSFVDEIPRNSATNCYTDTKSGDALGAPTQSAGFEAPPQNLRGICLMGNGILVGFVGSDLYFMEPYLPYAYKPETIKPLPHKIVGICPTDDGLYVTTTAHPYLITGVSPDTMTDREVPAIHAGVSKGGICSLGAAVAYASNDGIVMLRGIDASLEMSFNFFTRDSWRDRYASKLHLMRLNAHDGNIVVWFEDGTPGFLIRTEEGATSLTKLTDPISAAFVYPLGDALYVAQGATVYAFKGGASTKAFEWHSKDFIAQKPMNFGCIQLVGTGQVSVEIFADGTMRHSLPVTLGDRNVFRIPSGFLCRRWSVRVAGAANSEVTELYLANSPAELQNV